MGIVSTYLPSESEQYYQELLEVHIQEIARILYKNTPPDKIETFEGIEYSVREQVLEHVSPKIAFFCQRKDGNGLG
ncbi:MAG: hypothetical protein KME30_12935 [Iphinoe sp. HA4291-MV1]|jgi:hypothetical protein|nr:hypothetical protein [Iphinoe sp. HA4291-MV1]